MLKPGQSKTFKDYTTDVFLPCVQKRLRKVQHIDVSWDNYFNDSLKAKYGKTWKRSTKRFEADTRVPNNWEAFFVVSKNKEERFSYLSGELTTIVLSEVEVVSKQGESVIFNKERQ